MWGLRWHNLCWALGLEWHGLCWALWLFFSFRLIMCLILAEFFLSLLIQITNIPPLFMFVDVSISSDCSLAVCCFFFFFSSFVTEDETLTGSVVLSVVILVGVVLSVFAVGTILVLVVVLVGNLTGDLLLFFCPLCGLPRSTSILCWSSPQFLFHLFFGLLL